MAMILDTSALIPLEKTHATGQSTLLDDGRDDLFIATVTLSELLVGALRSDVRRRPVRQAFVDHVLQRTVVLAFDQAIAVTHASLVASLRSSGLTIGAHDMIIAATSIYHGLEVMTLDHRSFPLIPGVKLATIP